MLTQKVTGAILLHWLFTTALILGSQTADVYTFVTDIFIYSGNWVKGKPRTPYQSLPPPHLLFSPSHSCSDPPPPPSRLTG